MSEEGTLTSHGLAARGRRFWKVKKSLRSNVVLRDKIKLVVTFEDFECRLHQVVECFEALGEWWQREPKMPYKVLGQRRWMFARRWRDMHEVDEAKSVHEVMISSVSCMIRKIDDVEERDEDRSVNVDWKDTLTKNIDVLVMIQAFCFSSSALWCPREGSVFIGPCSSRRSGHHVHPSRDTRVPGRDTSRLLFFVQRARKLFLRREERDEK